MGAHFVKYGVNLRQQEADGSRTRTANLDSQKKTDAGLYVEGIWHWQPITLTTGLRYDRFSLTSNQGAKHSAGKINPSLGLIWDATDKLSFGISHNHASRSPRFYEALLATAPLRYDSALKAERSRNTEIGVNWSGGDFAVRASYFWQKVHDLQNFACMDRGPSGCAYYQVRNQGKLSNRGYEISARYHWRGLTARIGTAYSTPKLDGATVDSVNTAIPMGRQWSTGLSYKLASPNLELGWRGRYAQKGSYLKPDRGSGTVVRRAGYGVHDLYLSWLPLGKDTLTLALSIDNVGDKFYRSHSQRSGHNALAEPGRAFRLNVNYRY